MHRATETAFEYGTVNFAEFRGGGGILDADNNAVGMEKIRDGGAFAKNSGFEATRNFTSLFLE